jgi:hypothetical protein
VAVLGETQLQEPWRRDGARYRPGEGVVGQVQLLQAGRERVVGDLPGEPVPGQVEHLELGQRGHVGERARETVAGEAERPQVFFLYIFFQPHHLPANANLQANNVFSVFKRRSKQDRQLGCIAFALHGAGRAMPACCEEAVTCRATVFKISTTRMRSTGIILRVKWVRRKHSRGFCRDILCERPRNAKSKVKNMNLQHTLLTGFMGLGDYFL